MNANSVSLFPELSNTKDLTFTTGILPSQAIRDLIAKGRIRSATEIVDDQINLLVSTYV